MLRKRKIESEFMHKNLKCKVLFQPLGFRCGYVGLPKTHRLYKVEYSDSITINNEDKRLDDILEVHGGITYSGFMFGDEDWYFGFDCGHCFDDKDIDKAFEYELIDLRTYKCQKHIEKMFPIKEVVMRSLEYCIGQCKNLAEQLIQI